jgi:osmotically-inducible protein OsmY
MDDKALQAAVEAELARVAGGAPVAAVVSEGIVTLTGVVKDEARRTLIEQELLRLPEVLDVHNHLHVPLPAGDPAAQLRTLLGHAQVDAGDIEVAVADGVVTLSGAAQSWFDRDAAERLAWMLAGVHTVENRLALPPGAVEPDVEGTGQPAI